MKIKPYFKWSFDLLVRSVFQLHLIILLALTSLDYIDPLGPLHGEPVTFTLRGRVNILPEQRAMQFPIGQYHVTDTVGVSAILQTYEGGFIRLDYTDFSKAFSGFNFLICLTELTYMWIYLYVSWCFWKLSRDLKTDSLFSRKNIQRIRMMALVFPIGSLLHNVHGRLFAGLVNQLIDYPMHRINFPQTRTMLNLIFNTHMYYSIGFMIVILLLIQVFIHGNRLQNENALTI